MRVIPTSNIPPEQPVSLAPNVIEVAKMVEAAKIIDLSSAPYTPISQRRLMSGLLLSIFFHILILSMQLGDPGLGLPNLEFPWKERRTVVEPLSVQLKPILPKEIFSTHQEPVKQASTHSPILPAPLSPPLSSPPQAKKGIVLVAPAVQTTKKIVPSIIKLKPAKAAVPVLRRYLPPAAPPLRVIAQDIFNNSDFVVPFAEPDDTEQTRSDNKENKQKFEAIPADAIVEKNAQELAAVNEQKALEEKELKQKEIQEKEIAEKIEHEEKLVQDKKIKEEAIAQQIRESNAKEFTAQIEQATKQLREQRPMQELAQVEAQDQERKLLQRAETLKQLDIREQQRLELERQQIEQQEQEKLRQMQIAQEQLQKQEQQKLEQQKNEQQRMDQLRLEHIRQQAIAQSAAKQKLEEEQLERQKSIDLAERKKTEEIAAQKLADQKAVEQKTTERGMAETIAANRAQRANVDRASGTATSSVSNANSNNVSQVNGNASGNANKASGITSSGSLQSDTANKLREQLRNADGFKSPPKTVEDNPRRRSFLGAYDKEVPLRMYVDSVKQKIERNGNLIYAKRSFGNDERIVIVNMIVRSDGSLDDVSIVRSSGSRALDEQARSMAIVNAPYAKFPAALAAKYDVIEVQRAWSFGDNLRILDEVR